MPKFAVQILGFKKDIDSEKTIVKISDGANWIDAELGMDVEKLVKENYYNVLDVVIIMKTEGFPINGNFKIVDLYRRSDMQLEELGIIGEPKKMNFIKERMLVSIEFNVDGIKRI